MISGKTLLPLYFRYLQYPVYGIVLTFCVSVALDETKWYLYAETKRRKDSARRFAVALLGANFNTSSYICNA